MSRLPRYKCLLTALVCCVGTILLAGDAEAQRLRPRPITPRNNPATPKGTTRDVQGSVAALLNSQGLEHYNEHPDALLRLMRQSVDGQRKFSDTAQNRSPWGVMHTTLAWGPPGEILIDDKPYNAINALCDNQRLKGVRLLGVKAGLPQPLEGPGLQGHPGQLLAILAQNNVPLTHPIRIGDQTFSVADLVAFEKKTCKPNMELTFKLLGLSHYLPLDETWTAEDGGAWSVERLLRLELRQPINGQQTCGGTHRLMAIHLAAAKRIREGGEMAGAWAAASQYIEDYHEYALSLINPDGSCSTDWLERRAALDDPQRRVQTTGHVLEWLAVSLPDGKLRNEKLVGSFAYLSALLMVDIGETWSVGPRAHALRALRIYHDRLASILPGTLESDLERLALEIEIPALEQSPAQSLTDAVPLDSQSPPTAAGTDNSAAPITGTGPTGTGPTGTGPTGTGPTGTGTDPGAAPPVEVGKTASGTDKALPDDADKRQTVDPVPNGGNEGTVPDRVAALPNSTPDSSTPSVPDTSSSGSPSPTPGPDKPATGDESPIPKSDQPVPESTAPGLGTATPETPASGPSAPSSAAEVPPNKSG